MEIMDLNFKIIYSWVSLILSSLVSVNILDLCSPCSLRALSATIGFAQLTHPFNSMRVISHYLFIICWYYPYEVTNMVSCLHRWPEIVGFLANQSYLPQILRLQFTADDRFGSPYNSRICRVISIRFQVWVSTEIFLLDHLITFTEASIYCWFDNFKIISLFFNLFYKTIVFRKILDLTLVQ